MPFPLHNPIAHLSCCRLAFQLQLAWSCVNDHSPLSPTSTRRQRWLTLCPARLLYSLCTPPYGKTHTQPTTQLPAASQSPCFLCYVSDSPCCSDIFFDSLSFLDPNHPPHIMYLSLHTPHKRIRTLAWRICKHKKSHFPTDFLTDKWDAIHFSSNSCIHLHFLPHSDTYTQLLQIRSRFGFPLGFLLV